MGLFDIRVFPDDILRKECALLEEFTPSEDELLEKMFLTMKHYGGIGLAGPQVGVLKRLFVADVGEGPLKLVNPQIISGQGKDRMPEGCLSIPDVQVEVERLSKIVIKSLNKKGKYVEQKLEGLIARVVQHESDHLDGKLIVDYLSIADAVKVYSAKVMEKKNGSKNTF